MFPARIKIQMDQRQITLLAQEAPVDNLNLGRKPYGVRKKMILCYLHWFKKGGIVAVVRTQAANCCALALFQSRYGSQEVGVANNRFDNALP